MTIRSNLARVLFEKFDATGKKITIRELAREIDEPFESIRRLYNDETKQYPKVILDKLCTYLEVGVEDLIKYTAPENPKGGL